jgi:hypothetical protein
MHKPRSFNRRSFLTGALTGGALATGTLIGLDKLEQKRIDSSRLLVDYLIDDEFVREARELLNKLQAEKKYDALGASVEEFASQLEISRKNKDNQAGAVIGIKYELTLDTMKRAIIAKDANAIKELKKIYGDFDSLVKTSGSVDEVSEKYRAFAKRNNASSIEHLFPSNGLRRGVVE